MKRTCQVALGLMLGVWIAGCREDNPAYLGRPDAGDAGKDSSPPEDDADAAGLPDAARPDGRFSPDRKTDPDLASLDQAADLADVRALFDGSTNDSRDARGDEPGSKDFGSDPFVFPDRPRDVGRETFDSSSETALDVPVGPDGSDDVVGPIDAVVDSAAACTESQSEPCVTPGNPLVGACKPGLRTCSGGVWGACSDIKPAKDDPCNGIDDNCNGILDEGCAESCLVVCNNCGAADGVFLTIEAAIAAARQVDGGAQRRICVAGGTACDAQSTFTFAGPLNMSDGLVVQGGYAMTPDGLKYCDPTALPNTTIEFTGQDQGAVFDQSIVSRSELSGFVIHRASEASAGAAATIAGVMVTGAKNVSLSRLFVTDAPAGTTTYGVKITGGGQVTIIGSAIGGGQGRSAYGVYVSGASVDLRNNCDALSGGNCTAACGTAGELLGIRGRATGGQGSGESSAVFIGSGVASDSNVVGNTICGGYSNLGDGLRVAALRCDGVGCLSISGNAISGGFDQESAGLAVSNTSPEVKSNRIEGGCGTRASTGLFLDGSSATLKNNRIYGSRVNQAQCAGAGPGGGQESICGLRIRSSETAPSNPIVHSNDIEPLAAAGDATANCQSVGVLIERPSGTGGTLRNNIISAGTCGQRYAVKQTSEGGLEAIENNDLYGPAAPTAGPLTLYRQKDANITTVEGVNAIAGAKGNASADPRYASYPSDLHLTAESQACIDDGTAVGAPDTDADGVLRPQGAGYDIGAYELTP